MEQKKQVIAQGKTKTLYATDDVSRVIMEFRDDTTAFNNQKKQSFAHKGAVNNQINFFIMSKLEQAGIETQVEKLLSDNQTLVKALNMIPIEAVVRNKAAGSVCQRLGLEKGQPFAMPLFELFLKNDALGDPLIRDEHAIACNWATQAQITAIKQQSLNVNAVLAPVFEQVGIELIDFKLEFGVYETRLILGDEFSPDSCRLWEKDSGRILDKDRFRQDLGNLMTAYQEVAQRLGITTLEVG